MRWLPSLLVLGCAIGCGETTAHPHAEPATVQNPVPESSLTLVQLTPEAVERLAIETGVVEGYDGLARRRTGGEIVIPPGRTVTVSAPVAGVVRMPAEVVPGQAVEEGDTLFQLVPLASVDRDTRARANREVEAARAQLVAAQARLDRTQALAQGRAGSQRAIEEATAARDVAQADLDAAQARERTMRGSPLLADVSMRVRAPTGGIVRSVTVASGQAVAAGSVLLEVVDAEELWVRVPVGSGDVGGLSAGASVQVSPIAGPEGRDGVEGRPVPGPPTATPLAGTVDRYYALDSSSAAFAPGERVLVSLPIRDARDGTRSAIGFGAVFYDPVGSAWIYVCEGEGRYRRARVDVLRREGDVAVLARGPAIGTCVVEVGTAELYGSEFEPGH